MFKHWGLGFRAGAQARFAAPEPKLNEFWVSQVYGLFRVFRFQDLRGFGA